jgi:hypothetical protein
MQLETGPSPTAADGHRRNASLLPASRAIAGKAQAIGYV